jgi:hypothetical protein
MTDVSDVLSASIIRAVKRSAKFLSDYTAQQIGRRSSFYYYHHHHFYAWSYTSTPPYSSLTWCLGTGASLPLVKVVLSLVKHLTTKTHGGVDACVHTFLNPVQLHLQVALTPEKIPIG